MNWKKTLSYIPGVGLVAHTLSEIKERKEKPFPYYSLEKPEDKKEQTNKLKYSKII